MLLPWVFGVMYLTAVCAAQDVNDAREVYETAATLVNVTALAKKPKANVILTPDKVFTGESVKLQCTVDTPSGWDYLWYHNGDEIQGFNNDKYVIDSVGHSNRGQYHCKARRENGADYSEPSETVTLQVADPPMPVLNVLGPWFDVFPDESVELKCDFDSGDDDWWEVNWYRDGKLLQDDASLEKEESYLNISSVTKEHQGNYTCRANLPSRDFSTRSSNTAQITVYGGIPKPNLSKDRDFNPMYVGETVEFTCKVDVASNWEYTWYRDGVQLTSTNASLSIPLGLSDAGMYWCQAVRGEITSERSMEITQHVAEIPVPSVSLSTRWPDVFPTEHVALRCDMPSGRDWTYTWFRGGREIQADATASFDSDRATLSISSSSASHAGEYTCKGDISSRSVSSTSSPGFTLTVYPTKPSIVLTQSPAYNMMFTGESVTFSCHINASSGWEYLWYKDGGELQGESSEKYSIGSVVKPKSGSYHCKAKRGTNPDFAISSDPIKLEIKEEKPKPTLTKEPDDTVVYAGESVSFTCTLAISWGWEYNWYRDGAPLAKNGPNLTIHDATSTHDGNYSCTARRQQTGFITQHSDEQNLKISQIPVPALKRGSYWLDVFPTESVKLSCGMEARSEWTYMWYRDGDQVHADEAVSFDSDGTTLSISSASASHRGQYSCSGKLKSRVVKSGQSPAVTLKVYDTKPITEMKQFPDDSTTMHTGDSVTFSCHNNVSLGWDYVWYKNGNLQTASGINYIINALGTSDSGSYTCQAQRRGTTVFAAGQSQASTLVVAERPKASIVLLTGWSEVFSTDSLTLKCIVQQSNDTWDYKWYKAGHEMNHSKASEKYIVTPQDDPAQSSYVCRGVRKERPYYSEDSSDYPTKNLLLKRRLLLSISGIIFFSIIIIFVGYIVYRLIRKPVHDYEKPEEADMFLTMAQLKDRGDAPCPMVDFITDEALKAPPKEEGDENGMIVSESTPLPITVQDVTTESPDTAESNGGMVSFKQ